VPETKKNLAVVGLQWGDEGKGKIVDILSEDFDCVARYQGGHNAGHTVSFDGRSYVLHLIPSGVFHRATCVIGSGVVLDPHAFIEETDMLRAAGVTLEGRLFVSNRCHVIFPYHRTVEAAIEQQLGGNLIGTTSRGIGPAYEDKAGRRGLRLCDLMNRETLRDKITEQVEQKNRVLHALRSPQEIDPAPICDAYAGYSERLRPFVADTSAYVNGLLRAGKSILFEGAQATLLDVDHGTFPFVTSSSACAGGAAIGLGISPKYVQRVLGITKAYTTRVGSGPFPTEAGGEIGEAIREQGREYGASTGRPRRCGWFDGPAVRYSTMINGTDSIAVIKIDVLDRLAEIPFCVNYKYKGSVLTEFPAAADVLACVEPVYKNLPGWQRSTSGVREWKQLPTVAQDYLKFLSDYLETPISMVSTGAERDETIRITAA
jgi:adenylosuccinate synthase